MAITIKTEEQIEKMRAAGKILVDLDGVLRELIKPGVTTKELDSVAEKFIRDRGAIPFLRDTADFRVQYVLL